MIFAVCVIVVVLCTWFIFGIYRCILIGVILGKLISHKPSLLLRTPRIIIVLFFVMVKFCFSSVTMQLLSHNCPRERSDALVNAGKIYTFLASCDKLSCGK